VNQRLALALAAVIIVLLLGSSGLDYELGRIWGFQSKRLRRRATEGRARLLARVGWGQRYPFDLRQIRDLVVSLQLGTSMDQTLSRSLSQAAEQFKHRGAFGERLVRHVDSRLSIAPEEVLKAMAEDFPSEHLQVLPERLETARNGGISYDQALSLTAAQVEDEIRGSIRRDIQLTPIRLTFPMIGGVFLAALVLFIYPLLVSLLQAW